MDRPSYRDATTLCWPSLQRSYLLSRSSSFTFHSAESLLEWYFRFDVRDSRVVDEVDEGWRGTRPPGDSRVNDADDDCGSLSWYCGWHVKRCFFKSSSKPSNSQSWHFLPLFKWSILMCRWMESRSRNFFLHWSHLYGCNSEPVFATILCISDGSFLLGVFILMDTEFVADCWSGDVSFCWAVSASSSSAVDFLCLD